MNKQLTIIDYFKEISTFDRGSWHEQGISNYIKQKFIDNGVEVYQDNSFNL
ncbi:hypothetical protein FACS1894166_10060 [Bacilli bacterium]|nr:hypothetical protein FACS1894166_10060 [Bacilli bacterium]